MGVQGRYGGLREFGMARGRIGSWADNGDWRR